MSLKAILDERERLKKHLRDDALKEVFRLSSLLRRRYSFETLYLFGSLPSGRFSRGSDIDLVIEGLKTEDFFKAYAFLIKEGRFRVDLKPFEDLSEDFKKRVLSGGMKIE